MQTRSLGQSDPAIPAIGCGSMRPDASYRQSIDRKEGITIVRAAVEREDAVRLTNR